MTVYVLIKDERDYETCPEIMGIYETPELAKEQAEKYDDEYKEAIITYENYTKERGELRSKLEDEVVDQKIKPIGRRQAHIRNGLRAFDDTFTYSARSHPTKYWYDVEAYGVYKEVE